MYTKEKYLNKKDKPDRGKLQLVINHILKRVKCCGGINWKDKRKTEGKDELENKAENSLMALDNKVSDSQREGANILTYYLKQTWVEQYKQNKMKG